MDKAEKGEVAPWGLESKLTGKHIGTYDFVWWDLTHRKAEIGYILAKEYWNQGIKTEAVLRLMQFGFEWMELNRIEARCNDENIGSARVMEKVGDVV